MHKIAVLGSTGSIGASTLDVVSSFPDRFDISALSAHSNIDLLLGQAKRFKPKKVCVVDRKKAKEFRKRFGKSGTRIYEGEKGLCDMVAEGRIDTLVVGIVGSSALLPILSALDNVKRLALANKESLVMAGDIIMKKAKKRKVKILPVDSEHSAVFQCIESEDTSEVRKIYLTSSGGPLLCTSKKDFKHITPRQAVNHPKWKMGRKISVDSATMMNKGLEVIEAHHLFGVDVGKIEVLIHPETAVHSMVEFVDGSILAHMGMCDMRIPIQYALTYPRRLDSHLKGLSFSKLKTLHFYSPNFKKFPCLRIAYKAAQEGGTYPCVLNASNEVAVGEFLKGRINFTLIPRIVEKVLMLHRAIKDPELKDILDLDKWSRVKTKEILSAIDA
ncbi:1-deoxy-D-xylulose-5-phosphate reductoisomerase [Candidatus Omnitrophota bacterium]